MPIRKSADADGSPMDPQTMWHSYGSMGRKLICTLVGILLVYGIVYLGTLIRNNLQKFDTIGRADKMERTITVEADGKVAVTPDIAITSMGMTAEGKTVADAQQKNTDVMNKLLAKVKDLGVDKKDVQTTNYNIYPLYDYQDGKQSIRGYQVNQSVTIKIRDLSKANQVIALAGDVGANNVSGLQFTVDDRDASKEKARELALQKVAAKRLALSRSLGVNLRSIVSYNEYEVGGSDSREVYGLGGTEVKDAIAAPNLQPGSNEIVMHVSVIFAIQ